MPVVFICQLARNNELASSSAHHMPNTVMLSKNGAIILCYIRDELHQLAFWNTGEMQPTLWSGERE